MIGVGAGDEPHQHRGLPRAFRFVDRGSMDMSDEASFITGAEIPVDGGMTAHGGVKSVSDAMRVAGVTTPREQRSP